MYVILTIDITFLILKKTISLKRGEIVFVDTKQMIAYGHGYHFDITTKEFITVH